MDTSTRFARLQYYLRLACFWNEALLVDTKNPSVSNSLVFLPLFKIYDVIELDTVIAGYCDQCELKKRLNKLNLPMELGCSTRG